jgi:hypothetical protein
MNVEYREINAIFLHPCKTYVVSVEVSVMNVLYRNLSAVFLNPYKTHVLSVDVIVMNVCIGKLVLFSYLNTVRRSECNEYCI